jgi:hypothetical protein
MSQRYAVAADETSRAADDSGAGTAVCLTAVTDFFTCLRAILSGNRDPALLADPALGYRDVVELTLLLEALTSRERRG